jgi:hypothetical protein
MRSHADAAMDISWIQIIAVFQMWTKASRRCQARSWSLPQTASNHTRRKEQKMTSTLKIPVRLFFGVVALVATYAPAPAAASTHFDGNWSVLIVTSSGPCDRSYRFGLSIHNGDILYNGSAPVNLKGRVSGNGGLRVQVSAGAQSANGAGRLSRDDGRGHWRGTSASDVCAGSWTAQRQ